MASEIQAMLTVRYGEFINPLPEVDTLAKDLPFVPPKSRNGRSYNFPVQLSLPHGVTHSDTHTAFTLSSVVAPTMGEANITGAEILVRDNVAYADVFATRNGIANGGGQGGAYMD